MVHSAFLPPIGPIMQKTSFWKSGHTPTLLASFFYFDRSFMVWVILGPLAVQIGRAHV